MTGSELSETLANIRGTGQVICGRDLGYVALDVLWLLCRRGESLRPAALISLQQLEASTNGTAHQYRRMVPTLGSLVVPLLLDRLESAGEESKPWLCREIVDAIERVKGSNPVSARTPSQVSRFTSDPRVSFDQPAAESSQTSLYCGNHPPAERSVHAA
jgi:hypothetical protein